MLQNMVRDQLNTSIKFFREKKKIIRWVAFVLFILSFAWMFHESFTSSSASFAMNYAQAKTHEKLSDILGIYCFIFFSIFYATLTNHIRILAFIAAIFLLYDLISYMPNIATIYLLFLMLFELVECGIYKKVSKAILLTSDATTKVFLLIFKYLLKGISIAVVASIICISVSSAFTDYLKNCGWVPFSKYFSSLGYYSCGGIINFTLKLRVENDSKENPRVNFAIPYEYLHQYQEAGEVDEIKILAAYPTFEPWYKTKLEHPGSIESDPVEILIKIGGQLKSDRYQDNVNMKFLGQKFGLKEFYDLKEFTNTSSLTWKQKYYTSYYEPINKAYTIYDIHCNTTRYHYTSRCYFHTTYSTNLSGYYTFRHINISNWQDIDMKVRKLVASFVQSPHVETFYLIGKGDLYDKKN